jgi:hypothetical protein
VPHCRQAVGAKVEQHARLTAWPPGQAYGAAVTDQREVRVVPDVGWYLQCNQPACLLCGRARQGPAEPGDDPMDVGVNGDAARPIENASTHAAVFTPTPGSDGR